MLFIVFVAGVDDADVEDPDASPLETVENTDYSPGKDDVHRHADDSDHAGGDIVGGTDHEGDDNHHHAAHWRYYGLHGTIRIACTGIRFTTTKIRTSV